MKKGGEERRRERWKLCENVGLKGEEREREGEYGRKGGEGKRGEERRGLRGRILE